MPTFDATRVVLERTVAAAETLPVTSPQRCSRIRNIPELQILEIDKWHNNLIVPFVAAVWQNVPLSGSPQTF